MLYLTYRYNVNSNVERHNGIDFVHMESQLIGRTQMKMRQLNNFVIFENHANSTMVKTNHNAISVGIGPVHHSSQCVTSRSPDDRLKHDLKFFSEKNNVQCPPLPIACKHEKN